MHIATSPLTNRIYAGQMQDATTWRKKTDVTGAACGAVCEHVIANGEPVTVMCNGNPKFRITVEDLEPAETQPQPSGD